MPLRVAELEALFTANTEQIDKADKKIKQVGRDVESKPITQKVTADTTNAVKSMDQVEAAAKKLVSQATAITVNANVERAEKGLERTRNRLEYLRSVESTLDVRADIARAEANLQKIERQRDALVKARAEMIVDVNEGKAEQKLSDVADFAGEAGKKGGADAGKNLGDGIIGALASIPIAGAVAGIGYAVGKAVHDAFTDGLQQEVTRDRLQGLTGVDEATAVRFAYAAGESYANVFGESIEANMDTSRLALQFNILDEDATTRDAQKTVQALAGLSDVLGEEVQPIAAAVAALLSNGVVRSAEQAYDVIATGAREGVNRNEDMLDTLTEYPALFKRLGLSGEDALGLINQGMQAGARNSDLAADALKEFQIRATDASKLSTESFQMLGLNAEEMTAKIAAGGQGAREGLDQVLDRLRETEDPVLRNAAAVGLFGTQAEDLGEALFAMDLSTAVEQLDGVTGSAQRMFDTLADNDATKLDQAQRNIEVAVQGMQGALAVAFSEPLGDAADWISSHRGEFMQFLLDIANGALDFGESAVIAAADGTEAWGQFVAGPLADTAQGIRDVIKAMNPFADTSALDDFIGGMRDFDDTTADAADTMRDTLLPGIEDARTKLNEFGEGAVAVAKVHDASMRTAEALAQVGAGADGAVASGAELEAQVRAATAALSDEIARAVEAGESQDNLAERYTVARDALMGQLEAMGMSKDEAQALIDTVMQTPEEKVTAFDSNAAEQHEKVQALADRVETLPDGTVVINADTEPAKAELDKLIADARTRAITVAVGALSATSGSRGSGRSGGTAFAQGAVVEFMANGGLTPMAPIAQMVPPNTWRVVGDRSDVAEAYIPLDGSPRSMAILVETIRRMGGMPMAEGGIVAQHGPSGAPTVHLGGIHFEGTNLSGAELVALITRVVRDVLNEQYGNRGGL